MSDTKWRKYLETDPLSNIKPSLLSSDDIYQYAAKGCLVKDFDEERLLPAGYQFRFLGKLYYWMPSAKGKLERVELDVTMDAPITLPANSIAYLHMQDEFRLPQYIAARFNLRITHVHQGLLLGTGPMVDPGFWGRILVPLHNLTDNDYALMGGESLIHVEFTKLNPLERWKAGVDPAKCKDKYKAFPKRKIVETPDYYFKKAGVLANGGVVSNLNPALQEVNSVLADVRALHTKIEKQMTTFRNIGYGAGLTVAIALTALIYNGLNLVQSTNKVLQGVNETAHQAEVIVANVQSLLEADSTTSDPPNDGLPDQRNQSDDLGDENPNSTTADQGPATAKKLGQDPNDCYGKSESVDPVSDKSNQCVSNNPP